MNSLYPEWTFPERYDLPTKNETDHALLVVDGKVQAKVTVFFGPTFLSNSHAVNDNLALPPPHLPDGQKFRVGPTVAPSKMGVDPHPHPPPRTLCLAMRLCSNL